MEFKALTVITTPIASELVADIFFDIGGQGVAIIDGSDIAELYKNHIIWDYIDENVLLKTDIAMVTGYTSEAEYRSARNTLETRLAELKTNSDFDLGSLEVSVKDIDGEDWLNTWKRFYSPIELDRVVIVPSWQNYSTDKAVVKINPGMAFGTGEHESTKMCLALLEKLGVLGKTVSDIGCGSGILGIASLKLGASSCYFSDIDPEALNNMRENATLNGVLDKSTIVQASLLSGAPIGRDIILANLTADILIRLTAELPLYIDGNTQIIVSGIILERENDVLTAFAKIGLEQKERLTLNDWAAFRF